MGYFVGLHPDSDFAGSYKQHSEIDKLEPDSPEYWAAIEKLAQLKPSQLLPKIKTIKKNLG